MKTMLITGGTVFVSQFAARYFQKDYRVYVLNRNTREQVPGVTLIEGDRHDLKGCLKDRHFDVVLDITAYDATDVNDLLDGLDGFGTYVLISSSAVYPEWEVQPFTETTPLGPNRIWGQYGTDKIEAEKALIARAANHYILRPPYLYGPGNNVYREAFCFDCAKENRRFYLPGEGDMPLQFLHVEDLCRFIACILERKPEQRIYNVGNRETVTIREWVTLCYGLLGKNAEFVSVEPQIPQRNYFPFHAYAYTLDVERQHTLMPDEKPLKAGLSEAYLWYQENEAQVRKKPLLSYIDTHLL